MSVEGDIKLYNHFKDVIAGKFETSNSTLNDLRVSDAKKNMEDLVKKRPNIVFKEKEVKEEVKSKVKK